MNLKETLSFIIGIIIFILFLAYGGVWGVVSYLLFITIFAGIALYRARDDYLAVVRFGSDLLKYKLEGKKQCKRKR